MDSPHIDNVRGEGFLELQRVEWRQAEGVCLLFYALIQLAEGEVALWLSRLRSPTHFLLPCRCPLLTTLGQVFTLLKLLLHEVAVNEGVAVLVHSVGEVLAGYADSSALPPLELMLFNEVPLLHPVP